MSKCCVYESVYIPGCMGGAVYGRHACTCGMTSEHRVEATEANAKEIAKLWKRIIELEGPQGLQLIKGFRDESLKGNWKGYRSSRLNRQWRVIYKVTKKLCEVYVFNINPHEY